MSWNITPLYFHSSNLAYFGQKEPIKNEFSDFWVVGWKFTKFLVSCLKPQVSFSLNVALLFHVMRDSSSVLFKLKLHIIWTKGAHQSAKFRSSTAHVKFHQICTLVGSFYWKYLKFQRKKYRGVWRVMQNLKKKWFFVSKITWGIWQIFTQAIKSLVNFNLSTRNSENFYFNWFLLCKLYNVWPEKVQKSYLTWC